MLTRWGLTIRSARYHWRANLGALLASAAGCAVLTGALIVGDCVRYTLHGAAVERLGTAQVALVGNDRFFTTDLAKRIFSQSDFHLQFEAAEPLLLLPGMCANDRNERRSNDVQVCGVTGNFWELENSIWRGEIKSALYGIKPGEAVVNEKLADILGAKAGDTVRVRLYKPGILPGDAPLGGRDEQSAFMRVKLKSVVKAVALGRFSLQANQTVAANIFVPLADLQEQLEQKGRGNVLLFGGARGQEFNPQAASAAAAAVRKAWTLDDAQLKLRFDAPGHFAELSSPRVFLDDPLAEEILRDKNASGVVTYFANAIRANEKSTPYSMVSAAQELLVPADLKDDEIILNDWTSEDLEAKIGDKIELEFFTVGLLRKLETQKAQFVLKAIVPIEGLRADKNLMPDFPGIADVESTGDWSAGMPIDKKKIRPKDEAYWKKYKGTPKAFITLKRGTELWKNRFGTYTALRFPFGNANEAEHERRALVEKILAVAQPERLGVALIPVKEQALQASGNAMDFGGLFLGLSFFLIAAALLLMALIFQFGVESRARETGVLLALGFSARSVRALLWGEGLVAAAAGAPLGALGGLLYARALLAGLASSWQGAVGGVYLLFHVEPMSLLIGCAATVAAAALAIYIAVRKQAARPARELLNERGNAASSASAEIKGWKIAGVVGLLGAGALIALGFSRSGPAAAGMFFGSGALLLVAALAFVRWLLVENSAARFSAMPSLSALGIRAAKRKPGRSLAVAALLAIGSFLVCAIGVNELDANADAASKTSGTGGFAFFARATIPVFDDLNSAAGRKKLGLDSKLLDGVSIYPLRVKQGDEASCLNLNRAQTPRILGAPKAFLQRGGFTFVKTTVVEPERFPRENIWEMALLKPLKGGQIPAVCDAQSLQWALHLGVGDALNVNDEHGVPHAIKFVGAVANSILQGSVVISEEDFLKLYPSESGYRYFLIDVSKQERKTFPLTPALSLKGWEGERQGSPALTTKGGEAERTQAVADYLANALSDNGLEVQSAASRLAEYNAVQNTYLATFQALGALGMLLGSLGLGLVVLRNMLERRAELAMLRVLGFSRGGIIRMILAEHVWILSLGLLAGGAAALAAIAPTLSLSAGAFPWRSMSVTLLGIFFAGLLAAALGARSGLRSAILEGLKSE